MRVGLQIYGELDTQSGGYLYDRKLVHYLEQQGDSVEIFSLPRSSYWRDCLHNFDNSSLLDAGIDVLIQDELIHPAVFRSNEVLRQGASFPITGLVHLFSSYTPVPALQRWFYRQVESSYLHSVDGLIFNSQNTAHQASELMPGNLKPNVIALPAGDNFPDVVTSAVQAAESPVLRILYAGNVIRQKGLDVLINAVDQVPRGNCELTVAGRLDLDTHFVESIKNLIVKTGLDKQVCLLGYLEAEQLVNQYRNHDLLVMPSVNEAYGIVYLEAQQFGLPVIGTTSGGAREIIQHEYNGFLISPGDSAALANILRRLHLDRELLHRMSNNARAFYKTHPTWEDTGNTIRGFLKSLIAGEFH